MTPEGKFKKELKEDLEELLPGCLILMGNSAQYPGIPDWVILYQNMWGMLEVKKSSTAIHQPNQDWYVDQFNGWSFAAFVFPENKEEILAEIQLAFGA